MSDLDRYLTDDLIERAAIAAYDEMQHPNWRAPLWDEIDEHGRERFLNAARASLSAVLPDIIQQAKAEALRKVEPALQAMLEYGTAIRGDWSDFDGRTMQYIIEDWVREILTPYPSRTVEWHRSDLGLCMAGGGHWCGRWGHCDDECGCEPCAADRIEQGGDQ